MPDKLEVQNDVLATIEHDIDETIDDDTEIEELIDGCEGIPKSAIIIVFKVEIRV